MLQLLFVLQTFLKRLRLREDIYSAVTGYVNNVLRCVHIHKDTLIKQLNDRINYV